MNGYGPGRFLSLWLMVLHASAALLWSNI